METQLGIIIEDEAGEEELNTKHTSWKTNKIKQEVKEHRNRNSWHREDGRAGLIKHKDPKIQSTKKVQTPTHNQKTSLEEHTEIIRTLLTKRFYPVKKKFFFPTVTKCVLIGSWLIFRVFSNIGRSFLEVLQNQAFWGDRLANGAI